MSAQPDFITHVKAVYQQQRSLAEGALQQVSDQQFFEHDGADSNSLAIIVKHVGGNLRSRWTHFLKSDGEKPDRNRDGEFVADTDSREEVMRTWRQGPPRRPDCPSCEVTSRRRVANPQPGPTGRAQSSAKSLEVIAR
jgi:hypothetical protein